MRRKVLIGGLGLAVAASAAVVLLAPEQTTEAPASAVQHQPQLAHTAESPLFNGLPARKAIGPSKGELFSSPPPPKPAAPQRVASAPAGPSAPPAPPPMPYRVAGVVVYDGHPEVVLSKGDRVLTVQPGDLLDGIYRVRAIDADGVTLLYEPLGIAQHLPATLPLERHPRQIAGDSRSGTSPSDARP